MRVYKQNQLESVFCNKCGKKIKVQNHVIVEGAFELEYKWEYFSDKDGKKHSFDLCEKCYDEITEEFTYPVEEEGYTELV